MTTTNSNDYSESRTTLAFYYHLLLQSNIINEYLSVNESMYYWQWIAGMSELVNNKSSWWVRDKLMSENCRYE